MSDMRFGNWLRAMRKVKGISQKELTDRAGIVASHLSKIENGHIAFPGKGTRDRIHEVLGTTEEDLVLAGLLEKLRVRDTDGSFHTIYVVAPNRPLNLAATTHEPVDEESWDRLIRKLETVNLLEGGRLQTIEGMLDLWIKADEGLR